jgi:hypothetical protein
MASIGAQAVTVEITAHVGEQEHFAGTIHDDAQAKVFGYQSALVPGVWLAAQMAELVAPAWGMDWLGRGMLRSASRRPVYEGQRIIVSAGAIGRDDTGLTVAFTITDADGNTVATGAAGLPPAAPPPPDLGDFPFVPMMDPPPPIAPGEFRPGHRFGGRQLTVTEAMAAESLSYFRQTWPGYVTERVLHPVQLQRLCTGDALASYKLETPTIFVQGITQMFGLVHVGDTIHTAGVIRAVYERKGNHYYESDHVLVVGGTRVAALLKRTGVYAVRRVRAA